jgi:hypothetical protein
MKTHEEGWAEAMRAEHLGDAAAYQRFLAEVGDMSVGSSEPGPPISA